jgi:hypothetical protein
MAPGSDFVNLGAATLNRDCTLIATEAGKIRNLAGGTLSGRGTLQGNVENDGVLMPAGSRFAFSSAPVGELTIAAHQGAPAGASGNLSLMAGSTLTFDLSGRVQGSSYDHLKVDGAAALAGALSISLLDGFEPSLGDTFTLATATGGITGAFANAVNGSRIETLGRHGSFLVHYGAASTLDPNSITLSEFAPPDTGIPYDVWAAAQGLNALNKGFTADPNRDSVQNLAAYFLGVPALGSSAGTGIEIASGAGRTIAITFTSPATTTGVTVGTEWSSTLAPASWTPGPAPSVIASTP